MGHKTWKQWIQEYTDLRDLFFHSKLIQAFTGVSSQKLESLVSKVNKCVQIILSQFRPHTAADL